MEHHEPMFGQVQYGSIAGGDAAARSTGLSDLAERLEAVERNLAETDSRIASTISRVFGEPVALKGSGDTANAPKEPASLPALTRRIERIGELAGNLAAASFRLHEQL